MASCYLDDVLQFSAEGGQSTMRLQAAREKLLQFLESSAHYHAPQLLSKVQDSDLHKECALLYGRVSVCVSVGGGACVCVQSHVIVSMAML